MRVLVAVFDGEVREILARRLREQGHDPLCPTRFEAALEAHREEPFPLLLVGVEGEDLEPLRALAGTKPGRGGWVLAILKASDGISAELLAAGADDGLILPVEETALDLRLRVALRRAERRRAADWGSERNFRQLVETMNEGLGVRDIGGDILYANQHFCQMLGYEPEELVGRKVTDFVAEEDRPRFAAQIERRKMGEGGAYELIMTARDGRKVITLQSAKPVLGAQGEVIGSFAVITDITERKRAERRLRLTQLTVDHAADAVFWIGRDARFLYVNETACRSLGYSREELLAMTVCEIDPDFPVDLWEQGWTEVKQGGVFTRESRHRRKDGELFPVELQVHHLSWDDCEYHVAVARDITERKRAESRLRHNAFHDALTGLPNRALFMDRLQHCMDLAQRRPKGRFAVLFLDLDRFKVVNDSLGHVIGDELLARIASRLKTSLRAVDTVARIGGDEFLVLVEDVESDEAAIRVAERIQTDLQPVFHVQGHEIFTAASIGIALGEKRYRWALEVLRDADIAMYHSKARGGGCTTVFDREMHRRAVSRLELETDLRRALERDQLQLVYQPIANVTDGEIRCFEALLRWRHPSRGELAPSAFLEAAEETDLIVPISWWVLDAACRQARSLACGPRRPGLPGGVTAPEPSVSINLASRLIGHPELPDRLAKVVEEHGIGPGRLVLEVTESVILEFPEQAREVLQELAGRGFEIAIDDFGAGYSSLRYLSHLPVSQVKIDRSFVHRLTDEPRSLEITRSVVDLVHKLGMVAVAEGVETAEQLERLREMGCDRVQGYLIGRPESARHLLRRLQRPDSFTRGEAADHRGLAPS